MTNSNARIGARWWKFNFRLHTPFSIDYGRGDAAVRGRLSRECLLDCMRRELDCVAISDHNGGGWIDRLKSEYAVMATLANAATAGIPKGKVAGLWTGP